MARTIGNQPAARVISIFRRAATNLRPLSIANMKSKRIGIRTLAAAVVTALAHGAASAGPVLERIQKHGRLVIAHREASVPFSYLAEGQPVGYTLDICLRLAQAIRKQAAVPALRIEYLRVGAGDRIDAITSGRADLECGSTTNTAERREKVAFTVSHFVAGTRFAVRHDSEADALWDLRGKKVVATRGTTALASLTHANAERALGMTIIDAPEHLQALDMVERGEADAFALDDVLLYGLIAARPAPAKLKVVGQPLSVEPLAIMFAKNDPELKQLVDAEMRRLMYSHEAHAIYERWFQAPIPPANQALRIPMNHLLRDSWKFPSDFVPN